MFYALEWNPIFPTTQILLLLKYFYYFFEKNAHACLKKILYSRIDDDKA